MTQLDSGQSLASRFTLIRRLGRGGMGDVWLARDEDLGTELVTKIVPADATAEQISLLRQECRNTRRLAHPNIVRVFDFFQDSAATFITMEYVEGGDLCDLRGRPAAEIIRSVLPVIDALQHAHDEGVIHRDIKCGNVLIDAAGRPRLSDFGISGLAAPGPQDLQIAGGGSGRHASPQQLAGEAPSLADDIYGLGMMLRGLLSPGAQLPIGLEDLLGRMTAVDAGDRPETLAAVRAALLEIAAHEEESTLPPQIKRREVRLAPPPKVTAVRSAAKPISEHGSDTQAPESGRHPYWWLTVTAFIVLAVVVFAVFALLPEWVDQRSVSEVTSETGVEATKPEVGAKEGASLPQGSQQPRPTTMASSDGVSVAPQPPIIDAEPEGPRPGERRAPEPPPIEEELVETRPRPAVGTAAPARPTDPGAEVFEEAMSSGLEAIEAGDFTMAREAFERAVSVRPGSSEAIDGLARAEASLRLAAISLHRERAESFEQQERWREAEAEFKAALALDATLRFAREGESRAGERARLSEQMGHHIARPERMVDDRVLAEARDLLAEAETVDPASPGLERQIEELRQVVKIASTPVKIVLLSDNSTDVIVYRVGRLGRFDRHEMELRPGTYTVVGTRDGYRDVRRHLEVDPNGQSQPLTVRCEEKI